MAITRSEAINELAAALAKAQGEMGGAVKDAANPFFKSKYADLASVREACNGPLTKHGLSVLQSPSTDGTKVTIETLLLHTSGQWIRGEVSCSAKEDSAQAVGSAITYLRRYALQSFAGVAPEDDDGEAAHGRSAPPREWPELRPLPPQAPSRLDQRVPEDVPAEEPTHTQPPEGSVLVMGVRTKPTKNPNVKQFLIRLSNGDEVKTIRDVLAKSCEGWQQTQTPIVVKTARNQYGIDLLEAHPAMSSNGHGDDHGIPLSDSDIPF